MQSSAQITEFKVSKSLAEQLAANYERIDGPHHNARVFTKEEDDLLLAEWGQKRYRNKDIAALIGAADATVRKRAEELGCSKT